MESQATNDSMELQALFDEVAARGATGSTAEARARAAPGSPAAPDSSADKAQRMLEGIGNLSRALHDSLRELGYDRALEEAAHAIPDARDRLAYVATMTEQAAQRALAATELARPLQDRIAADASALSEKWDRLLDRRMELPEFRELVTATRAYLDAVPRLASATNAQLLEIMMAQDFQDLTGQVIKKITDIIQYIEQQLVKLLVENLPPERRSREANSLLNGPVVNPQGLTDVVTSQKQVDDLLESLGF